MALLHISVLWSSFSSCDPCTIVLQNCNVETLKTVMTNGLLCANITRISNILTSHNNKSHRVNKVVTNLQKFYCGLLLFIIKYLLVKVFLFSCFAEDSTNSYLNANWRPVSESLRPILTKTIEDILLEFMQQLFNNLPGNFMIGDVKNNAVSKKTDKNVWISPRNTFICL